MNTTACLNLRTYAEAVKQYSSKYTDSHIKVVCICPEKREGIHRYCALQSISHRPKNGQCQSKSVSKSCKILSGIRRVDKVKKYSNPHINEHVCICPDKNQGIHAFCNIKSQNISGKWEKVSYSKKNRTRKNHYQNQQNLLIDISNKFIPLNIEQERDDNGSQDMTYPTQNGYDKDEKANFRNTKKKQNKKETRVNMKNRPDKTENQSKIKNRGVKRKRNEPKDKN